MTTKERVNILMVDDQPAKLLSYEVMLGELDENLIKATSGMEALEHLLKTDVAVVLMDVSMPEVDGFELANMIRQHPRFQRTAIIFISAVHLTDLDRLKGYEHGAVDYISVPVVADLLRAKVRVFAELHRKTRQLETLNRELEHRVLERTKMGWMQSVQSGGNYEAEYRLRGKDGNYRWFRSRAVPIRDHNGKVVKWYGTCSDIHDSKLLEQSIRDSAIELERMVDERTTALRRLSGRLMTMQDEERRRIARDLHDGLGQELAVAKMVLGKVFQKKSSESETQVCAEASEIVDRAIQQVRSISHLLHPPLLDEVGLLSALRWYLEGLTERSGIETYLDVQPSDFPRLTLELETAVFRIVQEALTNVFRHAEAHKVWIALTQREDTTIVTVQDDGKGIGERIAQQQPDSVGVGIGGMKQRAKEFGGELRLTNTQPGTLVELVIPSTKAPGVVSREVCSA